MGAGGYFGDNPAKGRVQVGLSQHFGGQNLWRLTRDQAHNGGCGIVAAAFDAKKGQGLVHGRRCRKGEAQVTPWAWRNNPQVQKSRSC